MSLVLVNWLSDMKGVLGMAPVMIRSASACTKFCGIHVGEG